MIANVLLRFTSSCMLTKNPHFNIIFPNVDCITKIKKCQSNKPFILLCNALNLMQKIKDCTSSPKNLLFDNKNNSIILFKISFVIIIAVNNRFYFPFFRKIYICFLFIRTIIYSHKNSFVIG